MNKRTAVRSARLSHGIRICERCTSPPCASAAARMHIAAVCIRRRAGASAPPDGVPPLTELVVDAIAGAGPFAARRLGAVLAEARQ